MKALVVDDETVIRTALVANIKAVGYERIDTAGSGEEAVKLALQARYDLVTLDLHLPGVGGLDIIRTLQGVAPQSVIAVITGHPNWAERKEIEAADVVIPKPFRSEQIRSLAQLTREIVARYAAIRELGELHRYRYTGRR